MKLIISNLDKSFNITYFLNNYLKEKIIDYLMLNLDDGRCKNFDIVLKRLYPSIHQTSKSLIIYAINTLEVYSDNKSYIIEINSYLPVPNTSINLNTVINMIEFGTLNCKGLNIITKIFDYIKTHLTELINMYENDR